MARRNKLLFMVSCILAGSCLLANGESRIILPDDAAGADVRAAVFALPEEGK